MTITLQSSITKPSPCKNQVLGCSDTQLKSMFENILKQRDEYDNARINWVDNETVEVSNVSNLTLQSFLIQAEQQGKDIAYSKQTVIKIQ